MSGQKTSLGAAITTVGQSSITVSDFLGFPASGAFSILIDAEVLRVTAGNGTTTWTVTRGYSGTTAATHLIAATVTHVPDAYAELGETIATMALDGTSRYELILDLLGDVSRDLDTTCMRTFAVPTADVTFYCDTVERSPSLRGAMRGFRTADGRALDLVSITTLEVRDSETGSYVAIAAGDTGYYLEPGPAGTGVAGTDWAFEDVTLSPQGSAYTEFPIGKRAVKIVGKPGFPAVPRPVKRGVISETRERFRQSIGGGPAPIGTNAFGQPIFLTGDSPDMRRVTRHPFSRRPMAA
jgi:hypothetical protein